MLPCFALEYVPDRGLRDAVHGCEIGLPDPAGSPLLSDLDHLGIIQFCPAVQHTIGSATLLDLVPIVVKRSPEKQMVGANARWVITSVADKKAIGDWPVCQLPRNPMGGAVDSINVNAPMPCMSTNTCPNPAPGSLVCAPPEPQRGSLHGKVTGHPEPPTLGVAPPIC